MISSRFWRFSLLVCCLAVYRDAAAQEKPVPSVESRLKDVETRLQFLQSWLGDIDSRTIQTSTEVDCTKTGFWLLQTDDEPIPMLVSCSDLTPYLEGFRVTLSFGNLLSMQLDGLEGTLGYGENFLGSLDHDVSFTTVTPLQAGVWNRVIVTIPRVEAKDVRVISVRKVKIRTIKGGTQ